MKTKLTYKNLNSAHPAANNNSNYGDLIFTKDGVNYLFRNVEAPQDWDRKSDWTEDENHVMDNINQKILEKSNDISIKLNGSDEWLEYWDAFDDYQDGDLKHFQQIH